MSAINRAIAIIAAPLNHKTSPSTIGSGLIASTSQAQPMMASTSNGGGNFNPGPRLSSAVMAGMLH
jgi:hypothetical protein